MYVSLQRTTRIPFHSVRLKELSIRLIFTEDVNDKDKKLNTFATKTDGMYSIKRQFNSVSE